MLTDDERARLKAEEEFRYEVRKSLEGPRGQSHASKLWAFLNSNVGGWFLGTCLVSLFGFLWTRCQDARTADARAVADLRNSAQTDGRLIVQLLTPLSHYGDPDGNLAIEVVHFLKERRGLDEKLVGALDNVLARITIVSRELAANTQDKDKKAAFTRSAEAAVAAFDAKTDAPVAPKEIARGATVPARVYIQIGDEAHRSQGTDLQTTLREKGFLAPGVENVGKQNAPKQTSVFYFNDGDASDAAAVASIVSEQVHAKVNPNRRSIVARPGQIEVWFSTGDLPSLVAQLLTTDAEISARALREIAVSPWLQSPAAVREVCAQGIDVPLSDKGAINNAVQFLAKAAPEALADNAQACTEFIKLGLRRYSDKHPDFADLGAAVLQRIRPK